jgi:hypothetical protein
MIAIQLDSPEKGYESGFTLFSGTESLFPTLSFSPSEEVLRPEAEQITEIEGTITVSF